MSVLVGDSQRFAIEAEIETVMDGWVFGHFRFWAGGNAIGDWEDFTDLRGCLAWLRDFIGNARDRTAPDLLRRPAEELFLAIFDPEMPRFWDVPRPVPPATRVTDAFSRFHISHIGMSSFENYGLLLLKDGSGHERLLWAYNRDPKVREVFLEANEMEAVAREFCARLGDCIDAAIG